MSFINKKLLDHLASLAQLRLTAAESKRFVKDLDAILAYFKELQNADIEKVQPMLGAASLKNVMRQDEVDLDRRAASADGAGRIINLFPESEKGCLRVPKVL